MKVKKVWHRINKLMRAQESQAGGKVARGVQHKHRTETRTQSGLKGVEDWPHPSHGTSCAEKTVLNENIPTVYKETSWGGFPNSALCS